MSDFQLTAAPPLAGYEKTFGEVTLTAPRNLALVSIALPLDGEDTAKNAIKAALGVDFPNVGKVVKAKNGSIILRMAMDQGFVLFAHTTPDAERLVAGKLKGSAYTTDQTDVWTALAVQGPRSRTALERICPLDLHPEAFAVDDAARTVMEHLGTLIIRTDTDGYLLLSASSSAKSFLHAIETSLHNVS